MKFVASSTELFGRLQVISKVISPKNSLPILDNFLFDLDDNKLSITASDIETTIVTSLTLSHVEDGGKIAIPAKILLDTLKEFPEQPLTFEIDTENFAINIFTENGKYSIMGQNPEDFPMLPRISGDSKSITSSASLFLQGISKTSFATADDEMRPVMMGIFVDITSNDVTFVASDSHKLVRYRRSDIKEADEGSFILAKKPAALLKTILAKEESDITVTYDDKYALFQLPEYRMVCRLIEGMYPNYASVIPQNNPYKMIIDRLELYNALRRVSVYANQASNLVKLSLSNNQLIVSAQDLDFSISAYERLNCQYDGDDMEIGFKSTFLVEILSNLSCTNVALELSDPSRAGLVIPVDKEIEGEDVLMLIMPLLLG
ncbi:MAG TPA: DNA polymerase III subunit beta [Bacteroidales bacterium]|nr:DNA polymerase III subunit beta [Bacteroidales bacterium]HPO64859.1 DNA polymerase III subunit beta [Bacteroidales bacterium]